MFSSPRCRPATRSEPGPGPKAVADPELKFPFAELMRVLQTQGQAVSQLAQQSVVEAHLNNLGQSFISLSSCPLPFPDSCCSGCQKAQDAIAEYRRLQEAGHLLIPDTSNEHERDFRRYRRKLRPHLQVCPQSSVPDRQTGSCSSCISSLRLWACNLTPMGHGRTKLNHVAAYFPEPLRLMRSSQSLG